MQSKPKANSVVTHRMDGGKIVFVVKDAGELVFDPERVSATNRARAEIHGWLQRIVDGAAIERDKTTGKSATAHDKHAAMKRLVEHYESGTEEWRLAAGARAGVDTGLVIRAMLALGKVLTVEEANTVFDKVAAKREITREEAVKLFAADKGIGAKMIDLKAEDARKRLEAAGGSTADDLLDEIGGDGEDEGEGEEESEEK